MSHEQVVLRRVEELRTRIRMLVTQQWVCVGLTGAAVAGLLLVAATRFQWWTDAMDYLWALLLLGAVAGLLIGWTRRITPLVAAQVADERADLKERLSTAIELSAAGDRSEIAHAQLADAATHASQLQPSQVVPWRAPRQLRYLAAAAAVLLAAIFLPELPLFHSAQERLDREEMRAQGEKIKKVAKEIERTTRKRGGDENNEIVRRIAREMQQLGKDQGRNRISKKQAMLRMNELQKQLKEAEARSGAGNAQKSMEKVAEQLRQAAAKQAQGGDREAAKQLQQMADNLQKQDFEGAKRQLEELAKKMQGGKMSPQETEKAAEALSQMAEAMSGSGLEKASQELKNAAKELQKAAQQAKQLEQKMAQAKTDAERQQIQQQMSQALSQGMQSAAQQTQKAGGT